MDNKLNFKIGDADVELTFSPEGKLLVSLESDTTELEVTVQSPTKKSSQKWVGGAKKH